MKFRRTVTAAVGSLLCALLLLPLAGCQKEEQGPMEELGEKIDDAVDEVKDGAEEVKDEVEDAAEEVKDAVDGEGDG